MFMPYFRHPQPLGQTYSGTMMLNSAQPQQCISSIIYISSPLPPPRPHTPHNTHAHTHTHTHTHTRWQVQLDSETDLTLIFPPSLPLTLTAPYRSITHTHLLPPVEESHTHL